MQSFISDQSAPNHDENQPRNGVVWQIDQSETVVQITRRMVLCRAWVKLRVNSRNCRRGSQSTVGELEPEGRLRTDRGNENGGKGGNYDMHL